MESTLTDQETFNGAPVFGQQITHLLIVDFQHTEGNLSAKKRMVRLGCTVGSALSYLKYVKCRAENK